ncbi:mannose-6-phosphate receptor binding domain-containing protein [Gymnopilus junonius]|uniref:Autophagy-related protein 27 n=1 Tax=Gymnopilus junonius TaxID=109634 RepID=A0A9P5NMA5_GYMJU|nr:mannose-6-phosphate receptor binding domain-containing protein [Gymnopilus junonius]
MLFPEGLCSCLFFLFFLFSGAFGQENPCTTHDDGKYYDLNPLKSNKDYELKTSTGQKICLNICQNVRSETFGLKDDIAAGDVAGFVRRPHGDFAFGKLNTTLTVIDARPRLVMSNGSRCKAKSDGQPGDARGSSIVEFVCDASAGTGVPRLVAELPPGDDEIACAYVFEWRTKSACPTSEGGGISGFFAVLGIIFLALLMTYTVLGTLYNRYVLQLRGYDQIPQFSIESMKYHGREALDWIKDIMAMYNIGGSIGGSNSGYKGPATNPISHQSQVSGFNAGDDLEEGGSISSVPSGGFIRPQAKRTAPNPFQRADINPVSHQSQVNAQTQSLSFAQSPTPTRSSFSPSLDSQSRSIPQSARKFIQVPQAREPTKEEREFMLGEEESDAEELGEVSMPPSARPSEQLVSVSPSANEACDPQR